ncbi:hypothetical protein KIN20_008995 [Parelaphostrongylus tenuis]|uniref:Uncharacterized protein n=1 Tax=Parelaphostrongylus tenuis TaxID=148309 RepID=A0AAD5QN13_PARTN|nr:hypothetical protein KIN20_008995 [Parelaphostrongylus tenuis]
MNADCESLLSVWESMQTARRPPHTACVSKKHHYSTEANETICSRTNTDGPPQSTEAIKEATESFHWTEEYL